MDLRSLAVRSMTPQDVPGIAAWMAETPLWQRYQVSEASASAELSQGLNAGDLLLVATLMPDSPACGFVWCLPQGAFGRSAYIRLIGVQPGHTGAGIGARLMAEAERIAARTSQHMFLLVSDFNAAAQRFYRQRGYVQAGALPGYVLPDVAELIYWKRLVAPG